MGEWENGRIQIYYCQTRPVAPSPLLFIALALVAFAAVGFIVYQNYFQNRAANVVVASRVVPFSGAKGRENTPAFSPDGKQLTYSWNGDEGDNSDIYIRLVGAGEPLRLTETEANEQYPTFSPDGSHIAFVRQFKSYGEVIIVPSLGGAERKIARLFSGNYSISYAPDGQTIAVVDTENRTDGEQFAVYLINVETGERKRLTAPAEFTGETTPRFSPDGKSLAFVRIYDKGKQDLFVVPVGGGEPHQITFDGATIHSLTWSADARMIYFVSFRASNEPSVWQVSAGGGEVEIVSTGGKALTNIAASPDGKTLAFVETILDTDIWRAGTDKESAKKLIASSSIENSPQFSPDGSRIVFLSNRTVKHEIWTANADGKNLRQISNTPHGVISPQFSPDGSRLAFYEINGETSNIFIISAEGGAARQLTSETSHNILPAFSANGKQIYFTSDRAGEMNIWKMSADGKSEAVQITRNGANQAASAPDGKTIFYTKFNDDTELWRVPADGGAEEKLPEFTAAGFMGKWTKTKAGIYFLVRDSDQNFRVKFFDFADGQIKDAPGNYKLPPNFRGNFSTIADGNVFIFSLEDQNASQIMFAELPPAD